MLSKAALCAALFASASHASPDPADGFPWPDGAYAHVTETHTSNERKLVLTYYVKHVFDEAKGERTLQFAGVESMSVDGKALPESGLVRGHLFQPNIDLALDGSIEGVRDRDDVIALYREMFDAALEAGQLDAKAASFAKSDEAMDMTLARAFDRYCAWMCAAMEKETDRGERVVRKGSTPILGVDLPTQYEVWRIDDPADAELTVHSREVRDGRELGPAFKDALLALALRNGVEPPRRMSSAEPEGFAIEMTTMSKHMRSNLLPTSALFTQRVLTDKDAVSSEKVIRYELDWDWPTTVLLERRKSGSSDTGKAKPSLVNHEPNPTSADGSRDASLKSRPPPRYPAGAIRRRETGTTIAQVRVDAAGIGHDPVVVKSSGSAELDEAAVESLRHATFHPALEDGAPIEQTVEVPTAFRLDEL